ncbi:MAG: metal-dependent hydrolase [Flavobacteriales bacterium]|nr:metal-dependent hydrolase [Bacteroidota bacterium]MCB9239631.1 metal-dependent hydrolase [Flavobacteriales bacterium]
MAKIGYLGHSTFTIEMGGVRLITDPFITPNPLAQHIDFEALKTDLILITHGHQDHTADLLKLAQQTNALVIASYEITTWLTKQGYEHSVGMNYGGTYNYNGLKIKVVSAQHSSSFADGSYAGCACGYVLTYESDCVYFAGDTGLHLDMQLVGMQFDVKTTLMPIGDTFTMGYEDACTASDFVKCDRIIGMHFDTFPPIKIDKAAAKAYCQSRNKELVLMEIGEEKTFN